jgi:hypothetical protein
LVALILALGIARCSSPGTSEPERDLVQDVPPVETQTDSAPDQARPGDVTEPDSSAEDLAPADAADLLPDLPDQDAPEPPDVPEVVPLPDYEHDPAKVVLHGACPPASRVGTFKVEANEDVGYTALDGMVRNGVIPGLVPDVALSEGGCTLLKRRRLLCDPACDSNQTCALDEVCIPAPLGQDMGTVIVRGLVKQVEMVPLQPGNKYFYSKLDHPGFQSGDVVHLMSQTGYFGPFELYGVGVAQAVPAEEKWTLVEGQPLTLHWEAAPEGARSSIFLELSIDLHGLTPLRLECELPDTGEATLPLSVIDALVGAGVTGFPEGRFTRRTADSVVHEGECAEFFVTSVRQVAVEVSGHVPCSTDQECPPPLTCNTTIQQCE